MNLKEHLAQEHKISPLTTHLKEIVYGGNDGIVTTFAVVAGFAGAQSSPISTFPLLTVILFGLANLFADGLSMGLGNFMSLRAEQDVYKEEKAKELHEIRNNKRLEEEETLYILTSKGFSKKQAEELTKIYSQNENYWAEFMMKYELEMPDPQKENPYFTASATFLSFVFFGFIPLVPYIFLQAWQNMFFLSSFFTLAALIILGVLRWKVTKVRFIRSVGEIVLIGGIAATIAYFVGTFFRNS